MAGTSNPGSWAVVLPDHSQQDMQRMNMLWQHNQQQQQRMQAQQQREMQRQAAAAKFIGENFKDTNYATGTAADPLINQMTSEARQRFAKMIHENPNMDEADLEMQMQGDLSKISQYSSAIKAGRKNIDDGLQHYQQLPGIDVGALKNGAINRLIYQGGKSLVDDPNKIDLSRNYLDDELAANPQHYVIGDTPLARTIDTFKPKEGGDRTTNERAGVTTETGYTDKLYPWQSVQKDAKGNPIGLQTKSVPAMLSGQPVVDPVTHQPMQVVDDETLNRVMTPGVAAMVKRDTDDYIRAHGYDPSAFKAGSEAYQVLAKHILYNKLNDLTPSEFKKETKKTNASFVDKMQAGVFNLLGQNMSKAEQAKEEKLLNGNFGKIRQAVNLSPDAVQASTPYSDPNSGKQYLDVTSFVGGFGTDADKKASQYDPGYKQVQHLLIDPANPGKLYTVEGQDGHVQEYDGKGIDAIMLRHAKANGHDNLADVKKVIDKIPIQPNLQVARQARADLEYKRRKMAADAQQAILNPFGQQ